MSYSSSLADGEYVLTTRVLSPLPARLQSRRRGWMRASGWAQGTHFTVKDGKWECDRYFGGRNGADQLSDRQQRKVYGAVRANLELWAPALPSHVVDYDAKAVLDFLFTTGKITMDEVREAYACHNVGDAIGDALEAFCKAPPVPTPAPSVFALPPEQAPSGFGAILRVGDVIVGSSGPQEQFVVTSTDEAPASYMWQSADPVHEGCYSVSDGFHPHREHVVGHVSDMLAEGLAALSTVANRNRGPSLGYATGNVQPIPVHVGDILIALGNTTVRALVLGTAPSDARGPRARVAQLSGGDSPMGSISLMPSNGWVHEEPDVLGYDGAGNFVRALTVLRHANNRNTELFLVIGAAPADSHGPNVFFKQLSGPGPAAPWDRISLRPGNEWRVHDRLPHDPVSAPTTSRRAPEPVDAEALFSLD